ncbi:MAG: sulfatase-like hydrolase/transferase [Victivallales bacterium]|nr:sulfatase-like hydrolase/transferase [Victivallales bacterium]
MRQKSSDRGKRLNVLWLMSDQHNANCAGYAGHPNVKTPGLDRIAQNGIEFTNAFANNPICSPSRICFMTGQHMHTHRMFGNNHAEYPHPNPDTLASLFRRYGYQTGLFGKSHMIRRWDQDGFERIRYTDLCDAQRNDPTTTHYFANLEKLGLTDLYEEGNPKPGQLYTLDGSAPAQLPYEHSIERFTGDETLKFLDERDVTRPFFIHMSFQRPHSPIAPAPEYFNLYDPADIILPNSAADYFENKFAGKPTFMQKSLENGCGYPLADPNPERLKRCLASYFALITCIDMEIGRVLDRLEKQGELENTVVFYTADHGDFAGEHGLFHKNFGIYDSIQKIPFLLSWPGSPKGMKCPELVESVDLYPTLCELCDIPMPQGREGQSVLPLLGPKVKSKDAVFCEWEWSIDNEELKISAIRTRDFRLVYYNSQIGGELYNHLDDPGETVNLWNNPQFRDVQTSLLQHLFDFTLKYQTETSCKTDRELDESCRFTPTRLLHKQGKFWSDLTNAYQKQRELQTHP